MSEPVPSRPEHPPIRYVSGGWPDGTVQPVPDDQGGELVRYQVEQARQFVADVLARQKVRGPSQAHLARATRLRRNTISDLLSGQRYPDWSTISRLAYALEADIRFVGRSAVPTEPPPGAG